MAENSPTPKDARKPKAARSIEARLLARSAKSLRHGKIFNQLTAGMSVAEIALGEGVSPRRMRETVQRILARREVDPAEGFVKLQTARLNDAMKVAHTKMWEGDMQALDRVVRLVHELERYSGFRPDLAAAAPPRRLAAPEAARALPSPQQLETTENDIASL